MTFVLDVELGIGIDIMFDGAVEVVLDVEVYLGIDFGVDGDVN